MSLFGKVLGAISGGVEDTISQQLLYDKVIGFRGIVEGVGCSTMVQNVAVAIADLVKTKQICVVDTNIMYPSQQQFLIGDESASNGKDWFDFDGTNLAECREKTRFSNIYLLRFNNRTITDMLSSKDNPKLVHDTIAALKTYFDVILVDLSHETTNISMHMALQCNQIYTVVDPSMKCISNLGKSLNYMGTLAVPFGKMNKTILNKNEVNVNAGIKSALAEVKLDVIATIPNSLEISKYGIIGKRVWATTASHKDVAEFNNAMKVIVNDIFPPEMETRARYLKTAEELTEDNHDDVVVENTRKPDEIEREVEISKKEMRKYMKERKIKEKLLRKQGMSDEEIKKQLDDEFFETYGATNNDKNTDEQEESEEKKVTLDKKKDEGEVETE